MKQKVICILLPLAVFILGTARAQDAREDVIIMKDSTIIRGTITQTVSPGSSVTIKRASGKVTSILWNEIRSIRQLPAGMPDSVITALYVGAAGSGDVRRTEDDTKEDILALGDGRILRGTLTESPQKGSVGLWTHEQKLLTVPRSEILRTLRLEKGESDSAIDVMYVHPRPEMVADTYRYLTLFGGLSMAAGKFGAPTEEGSDPAGSGYALGLQASIRIVPMVRWATTLVYGSNSLNLPEVAANYSATGSPDPYRLIWVLTGAEVRTEGTSWLKASFQVQAGKVFTTIKGFDFTIPATARHPAGTGSQEGSTGSGFAFCIGGGVSTGRFSLTGRWLTSTTSYEHGLTMTFDQYGTVTYFYKYDQPISVVLVTLGFSPI